MPQPHKGLRTKITVRMPVDVHAAAAKKAAAKRWNMSEFVNWCVEQTVNPNRVAAEEGRDRGAA
jgi:predicted HicB family RNase H-like nuclease